MPKAPSHNTFLRYQSLLRRLRRGIFNPKLSRKKEEQITRLIEKAKSKVISYQKLQHQPKTGPYSGLTRHELSLSGTNEPDWY